MLEIEMKFKAPDFQAIQHRLRDWGARADEPVQEADHYYGAPDRDFGQTDEALRVRRIDGDNRVTYKGPRRQGPVKTRTEIEVGLAAGNQAVEDFCRLLTHLGYRPVAVVHKERTTYHFQRAGFDLAVCLDDVADLGRFLEIEILAGEQDLTKAENVLQDVARELELRDSERRSYLEMLLARRKGKEGK